MTGDAASCAKLLIALLVGAPFKCPLYAGHHIVCTLTGISVLHRPASYVIGVHACTLETTEAKSIYVLAGRRR